MTSRFETSSGGARAGQLVRQVDRVWGRIVGGLAAIGTLMIGVLMLLICADIVFRNGFGSSLPLVSEIGGLMLVMIVYLQLASAVRARRLARTEIFLPPLLRRFPRAGAIVAGLIDLVGAVMLGVVAYSTLDILGSDISSGEYIGVPGIATLVTWPFRLLILIGIVVAALEFVMRAISSVVAPAIES